MNIGCSRVKQQRQNQRGKCQGNKHHHEKLRWLIDQRGFGQPVVCKPTTDDKGQADDDAQPTRHIHDRLIDQIHTGREIIDNRQQQHTADPGPIRFPLKPMQGFGHLRGCHSVLLHMVEPTAVHRPQLAFNPFCKPCLALEMALEPIEVERSADPGNPDNEMNPANYKVEPFCDVRIHAYSRFGSA